MSNDSMNAPPAVSVIMPCYNSEATISEAVHSVEHQTFRDFELIVVNDGSTDGSRKILEELASRHSYLKVIDQKNRGLAGARNRGLAQARGRFVAFLDSDDTWAPEFLEKMHQAMCSHPEAVLAYCGWRNIGVPKERGRPFIPPDYEIPNKEETFLRGCRWPVHAVMTRRDAICQVGGFNETLRSCEDYDLWLRLAITRKIVRVPEVLAFYHHHEGEQLSKNHFQMATDFLLVQQQFLKNHPHIQQELGKKKAKELTYGELQSRALRCLWDRDLHAAQRLFRKLFYSGYINRHNLKYLLPSLLPYPVFKSIVRAKDD